MPKELVNVKKHPVVRRSPVEDGSEHPVIYMGFYASQVVIAGFLNHQQCRRKQNDEDDSQLVLQLFFCEPGGSFFNQRDGRGRSQ